MRALIIPERWHCRQRVPCHKLAAQAAPAVARQQSQGPTRPRRWLPQAQGRRWQKLRKVKRKRRRRRRTNRVDAFFRHDPPVRPAGFSVSGAAFPLGALGRNCSQGANFEEQKRGAGIGPRLPLAKKPAS